MGFVKDLTEKSLSQRLLGEYTRIGNRGLLKEATDSEMIEKLRVHSFADENQSDDLLLQVENAHFNAKRRRAA